MRYILTIGNGKLGNGASGKGYLIR